MISNSSVLPPRPSSGSFSAYCCRSFLSLPPVGSCCSCPLLPPGPAGKRNGRLSRQLPLYPEELPGMHWCTWQRYGTRLAGKHVWVGCVYGGGYWARVGLEGFWSYSLSCDRSTLAGFIRQQRLTSNCQIVRQREGHYCEVCLHWRARLRLLNEE